MNKKNIIFYYNKLESVRYISDYFQELRIFYDFDYVLRADELSKRLNEKKYSFIIYKDLKVEKYRQFYPDTEFLYFDPEDLKPDISDIYNDSFYSFCKLAEGPSSENVSKIIYSEFKPENLIDVGCGCGIYLNEFLKMGIDCVGIDNSKAALKACKEGVKTYLWDINKMLKFPDKFDLAICFEVAEHIPEASSNKLVKLLCENTETVIFSAAPPGQGGFGHINEQNPEFWINIFETMKFEYNQGLTAKIKSEFEKSIVVNWLKKNLMIFQKKRTV